MERAHFPPRRGGGGLRSQPPAPGATPTPSTTRNEATATPGSTSRACRAVAFVCAPTGPRGGFAPASWFPSRRPRGFLRIAPGRWRQERSVSWVWGSFVAPRRTRGGERRWLRSAGTGPTAEEAGVDPGRSRRRDRRVGRGRPPLSGGEWARAGTGIGLGARRLARSPPRRTTGAYLPGGGQGLSATPNGAGGPARRLQGSGQGTFARRPGVDQPHGGSPLSR